jgi:hypothetical protein
MHLKTYCESVRNHYDKYKQTSVNPETLLGLVDSVQKLCLDVLELRYDEPEGEAGRS